MPHGGAGLAPVSQARHLTDRAATMVRLGEHRKALDLLLTAENTAGPEWVKYQSLLEQVVSELLDHDRRPRCATSPTVLEPTPDTGDPKFTSWKARSASPNPVRHFA